MYATGVTLAHLLGLQQTHVCPSSLPPPAPGGTLVVNMTGRDPKRRISAADAMRSPFVSATAAHAREAALQQEADRKQQQLADASDLERTLTAELERLESLGYVK